MKISNELIIEALLKDTQFKPVGKGSDYFPICVEIICNSLSKDDLMTLITIAEKFYLLIDIEPIDDELNVQLYTSEALIKIEGNTL